MTEWEYVLIRDDTAVFEVRDVHDATDPKQNRITVKAKSENGGNAVLKVCLYLTLKADPDTKSHIIDIVQ